MNDDIDMMKEWYQSAEKRISTMSISQIEQAQETFNKWLANRIEAEKKWRLSGMKEPRPVSAFVIEQTA